MWLIPTPLMAVRDMVLVATLPLSAILPLSIPLNSGAIDAKGYP
jgi:hypothetical protein